MCTAKSAPALLDTRWTLASLSLSALLPSLGISSANVALPTLQQAFGASFQGVQWVLLAYLVAISTAIVGTGRLGDLLGRRRLLLAGIALFTLGSLLCGLAPSLPLLIAARALQGVGAAAMMALSMALVGDVLPKSRTGRAMGLLGTMSAIGTALGPSLGGLALAATGWPALFFVNLPLGLLAFALARRHLPADRPRAGADHEEGFDAPGAALLGLSLAAYALAMTLGRGRFGLANLLLLAAALVGAALFALVESKVASPLVRLPMLRRPTLGAGFATSALVSTVVMATLVVGPFYLAGVLALEPLAVGLAMSCGPLVAALTGMPAGRLVDRLGAPRVVFAGLGAMMSGSIALPWLPASAGVAGYLAPLAVITAGYALFQAANNTAVMADGSPEQRGVVSALLNLSRNLGLVTGASLMGAVFAFGAATADIAAARPEAVAAGLRGTFGVATALIAAAIAIAAWGSRNRVLSIVVEG